jgi:hypothetical protein
MKTWLLGLAIVVMVSGCSKEPSENSEEIKQAQEACENLSKFAEHTMRQRQANTLMSSVFKEVDQMENVPDESKGMLKEIVMEAYKRPMFTVQPYIDQQTAEFANDVHLQCLEAMK